MNENRFMIRLMNQKEQMEFVNICSKFDCDIDLVKGISRIDAKSLMGVASLNTTENCFVEILTEEKEVIHQIKKALLDAKLEYSKK